MITTKAGYEIMTKPEGMSELQWIEQVARTCYKSEDKITADGKSAETLVRNLLNRKHYAMIEHATIILKMEYSLYLRLKNTASLINETDSMYHTYLKFSEFGGRFIVSGNIRAWLEFLDVCNNGNYDVPNNVLHTLCGDTHNLTKSRLLLFEKVIDFGKVANAEYNLEYCEEIQPNELETEHEMLVHFPLTIKWTCDRGVSHELVRHRDASFAQESTRYCNYSKNKYGNECTFIDLAPGMELDAVVAKKEDSAFFKESILSIWADAMKYVENAYLNMIKLGATPQIARSVLPNSTKTEVVMTATMDEWVRFFALRIPASAHPQMREITIPCFYELHEMYPTIFSDSLS